MTPTAAQPFSNPFVKPGTFRSPGMDQAKYSALKTHMTEHHWLQAAFRVQPEHQPGTYGGCEPYYFNGSGNRTQPPSSTMPTPNRYVRKAERPMAESWPSNNKLVSTSGPVAQANLVWGRWYYSDTAYDFAQTSFHILTTEGIRGRDILAD